MPISVVALMLSVFSGTGSWLALTWPLIGSGGRIGVSTGLSGFAILSIIVVFVTSGSGKCNAPCPTKGGLPCDENVSKQALLDHRCWRVAHSIRRRYEQYDDDEVVPTWYQEWWKRLELDGLVMPVLVGGGLVTIPGLIDLIRLGFTH